MKLFLNGKMKWVRILAIASSLPTSFLIMGWIGNYFVQNNVISLMTLKILIALSLIGFLILLFIYVVDNRKN